MTFWACLAFSIAAVFASLFWLKRKGMLANAMGRAAALGLFAAQLVVLVALSWLLSWCQKSALYSIALCIAMTLCCVADCAFLQESSLRLSRRLRQERQRAAETRLAAANSYQKAMASYVAQTDGLYEGLLSQIDELRSRIAAGDGDAFQGIEQAIAQMDAVAKARHCQNRTIDALLTLKALEAEEGSVRFSFSGAVPEGLRIEDLELCSVFSNLIDNALNAARSAEGDARYVDVVCSVKGAYLIVGVTNGVADGAAERLRRSAFPGKLASLLPVRAGGAVPEHGWGLKIVREICSRYAGSFSLEAKDSNSVTATAILSCMPFESDVEVALAAEMLPSC